MKPYLFLTVLFIFTALNGCKKDNNTIRVLLDWTPNTNHTGLYVALEKGWFTHEGLNVIITQPPEDAALALVASGKAEFGITFQEEMGPAIAKRHDALPLQAVAAIINRNTSGIMSLNESGIQKPFDLAGRRFATWETPLVTEIVRYIVEKDGGDFNAVKMIPNSATDAISALQTDVDAIWVYYAWDGIAAEVNDIEINFIDFGTFDDCLDFYTPVIAANTKWASENTQTVKKFLNAVSKGYYYAMENHAESSEILLKHAPELDKTLVMRSQEYLASRYQGDAERWGEIDPERWSKFYHWMFENKLLETDIGAGGFTSEYLP